MYIKTIIYLLIIAIGAVSYRIQNNQLIEFDTFESFVIIGIGLILWAIESDG